jgi:hypothetical protein
MAETRRDLVFPSAEPTEGSSEHRANGHSLRGMPAVGNGVVAAGHAPAAESLLAADRPSVLPKHAPMVSPILSPKEQDSATEVSARVTSDELKRQIDALSLEQALIDFEVANARVLDLTGRLVATSKRVVELQAEADGLRLQIEQLRSALDHADNRQAEITGSRAYRWGNRLSALRAALRS